MKEKQVIAKVKAILTETEEGTATAEDLNNSINTALEIIGRYERIKNTFYPEKKKSYSGQALNNIARFDGAIFLGWGIRITLRHEVDYIAFIPRAWYPETKAWEGVDHYGMNRTIALTEIESLMVVKGGR